MTIGTWSLILAFVLIGLSGCDPEAAPKAHELAPAGYAEATFALISTDEQLLVLSGGREVPVEVNGDEGSTASYAAAAIDANKVATVYKGHLVLIGRDGLTRSVSCSRCRSVIWSGQDLIVLSDSQTEGETFDLLRFTTNLELTAKTTARQVTERTDPNYDRYSGSAALLAANDSTVWASYADRFGFARGGSRTIAAYDRDGRLLASTRVNGSIYASSISPSGRFLALADGGSSGACITAAELDVIDLTTMQALDTTPRIPVKAWLLASPDDVPDINFATYDLHWNGESVLAVGETSRGNDPNGAGGCDPQAKRWVRVFDTSTQTFADTEIKADPGIYVGPTCGDRLRMDSSGREWILSTASEEVRHVDVGTVLYHPPLPDECS